MTHPGGRPRKYKSVDQLQIGIDNYFDNCEDKGQPFTVTGLALALGFTSRQDLINNEGYSAEFHDALKRAKSRCENYAENKLFANNPTGAIFALKNYGWKDKSETELTGPGGGPIQAVSLNNLSLEELEGLERLALKASSND